MRYPEIVSLIDGTKFRFPEPYFIGDMEGLAEGNPINRDPDWFRGFDGAPTEWTWRNCELCNSNSFVVRHIIGPSRVVKCRNCGLEYDNPQAVVEVSSLDKYASEVSDTRKSAKSMLRAEQTAEVLFSGLMEICPKLVNSPLLDIGCASGEF